MLYSEKRARDILFAVVERLLSDRQEDSMIVARDRSMTGVTPAVRAASWRSRPQDGRLSLRSPA